MINVLFKQAGNWYFSFFFIFTFVFNCTYIIVRINDAHTLHFVVCSNVAVVFTPVLHYNIGI